MNSEGTQPEVEHANVDHAEIRKFEELAHRWWDPESEFRPLHEINPLRLDYIDRHVALAGRKVVDVGCGGGLLSEAMAARGAEITGIDMGETPLSVARLHLLESGQSVEYLQTSAEALAQERPSAFDVVTCMEMLEHVPEPESVVHACAQLVRPGGQVIFSTINRNPRSFLFAIVGAEYLLRLLPRGTHEYARFIRPSELETWARRAGLIALDIVGMSYNPLTRRYALGDDMGVNYIMRLRRDV